MQTFIRPNEGAFKKKMLRIHHQNLFHMRRSLHLIFLDGSCTGEPFDGIMMVPPVQLPSKKKLDAKIDEYEISSSDESEAFFYALSFGRIKNLHN